MQRAVGNSRRPAPVDCGQPLPGSISSRWSGHELPLGSTKGLARTCHGVYVLTCARQASYSGCGCCSNCSFGLAAMAAVALDVLMQWQRVGSVAVVGAGGMKGRGGTAYGFYL
jgi:hypothetical protein